MDDKRPEQPRERSVQKNNPRAEGRGLRESGEGEGVAGRGQRLRRDQKEPEVGSRASGVRDGGRGHRARKGKAPGDRPLLPLEEMDPGYPGFVRESVPD